MKTLPQLIETANNRSCSTKWGELERNISAEGQMKQIYVCIYIYVCIGIYIYIGIYVKYMVYSRSFKQSQNEMGKETEKEMVKAIEEIEKYIVRDRERERNREGLR